MTKPLVSIIIPAYNAEKYLGAAIESVLKQTYENWELVIVVDGGCTDSTAQIAESYARKDPRIICHHQEHVRMAAARNFGIKKARGSYVAFLDADNLFLPGKLEQQAAYLDLHPECGICYSRIYHFYNNEPHQLYQSRNETLKHSGKIFKEALRSMFINVLAALVRKELLYKYGAFPEGWPACDDHYFWANLAYYGVQFCPLDVPVGLLRLHGRNDSMRPGHILDTANGMLKLLKILEERFKPNELTNYQSEVNNLRRRWQISRLVGWLMIQPIIGWLLLRLYLARRNKAYEFIGTAKKLGVSV